MMSSCILGSVPVEKSKNWNFFVYHPICLEFGIGGNFKTLIIKRRHKLKVENDLREKMEIFYRF